MSILPDLHVLFVTYGVWAVFLVVMLESAGLPCPGETTLILSAAYAGTTHNVSIELVVALAAAGAIIGDNFGYWIGRGFGFPLLVRYGRYIHLDEPKLKLGEYLFRQHGGKIVFFGRFVPLVRSLISIPAGMSNMPFVKFLTLTTLGTLIWNTVLIFVGVYVGENWQVWLGHIETYSHVMYGVLAVILLGLGAFIVRVIWSRRSEQR